MVNAQWVIEFLLLADGNIYVMGRENNRDCPVPKTNHLL